MGYTVLILNETATELMNGGISPRSCGSLENFQRTQMQLHLAKERAYETAAKGMQGKVLMVCDRGTFDSRAYMSEETFLSRLGELGVSKEERLLSYGAVFHLHTAAKGAVDCYTTENNRVRTETPEEAVRVDDRLLDAWSAHPYVRIIPNGSGGFAEKLDRLLAEIAAFLEQAESPQSLPHTST